MYVCRIIINIMDGWIQMRPLILMLSLSASNNCAVSFLLRDAYAYRGLWQDVCPSVCPSHAGIVSKCLHISSNCFHRRETPSFQFFSYQTGWQYSDGDPLTGASNAWGCEKSRFSTNIRLYLGIDARWSHSCYRRRIGNCTQAFEWYQFELPWVTSNPYFKVTILFNVKYNSKNGTRWSYIYNSGPVESHLSNDASFNDLEQPLTQFSKSRYTLTLNIS